MSVLDRIYCLYLGDTGPTKYWSVWVAIFAAMGMTLRSGDGGDMSLLIHFLPWWVWALMLMYIVTARVVSLFWWKGILATRLFTPMLSIFVWSMFFASQFVAPNFGLGLLFLVPACQETWILSRVFWDERLLWKTK